MKLLTVYKKLSLLIGILVILCLISCTSGVEKADNLLETLSVPPNVDLLYTQNGVRQGSQDACFFPYIQRLYGTNQSFEQIIIFYETTLDQSTWRKRTDNLVPHDSPSWEKDKEFWLSLRVNPELDFPKEVVSKAQSNYKTVYFVTVTYIDRLAREQCLSKE